MTKNEYEKLNEAQKAALNFKYRKNTKARILPASGGGLVLELPVKGKLSPNVNPFQSRIGKK